MQKQLAIGQIKFGFATNSSSSHSIIFFPNGHFYSDELIDEDEGKHTSFGWENFVAASDEAKTLYVAATLYGNLIPQIGHNYAKIIIKEWLGVSTPEAGYSIDHQSFITLPGTKIKEKLQRYYNSDTIKIISEDFFKDFANFIKNEKVVITGGNDNEEDVSEVRSDPNGKVLTNLIKITDYPREDNLIARKHDNGTWFLFDPNNGSRIAINFDNPTAKQNELKPSSPLLVDLKITDYCEFACHFCYQNSAKYKMSKGANSYEFLADLNTIKPIIFALQHLGVFEVAIGGGDPTSHPQFINILNLVKNSEIVPSLSSRDVVNISKMFNLDEKTGELLDQNFGAAALSVNSAYEIKTLLALINKKSSIDTFIKKGAIHYVMGSTDIKAFASIVQLCISYQLPLVLLGYKSVGRGKHFIPKDYNGWIDIIKDITKFSGFEYSKISIDTTLAKQFEKELIENNIPETLWTAQEGISSLYIDAVTREIAPFSYAEPELKTKLDFSLIDEHPMSYGRECIISLAEQIKNKFIEYQKMNF